jgi:hypothetical protein
MSTTSISYHRTVAIYWDRSDKQGLVHLHFVDEDGGVLEINAFHRDGYTIPVREVTADEEDGYNPAYYRAGRVAGKLRSGDLAPESILRPIRRSRGDDDYSGVSLPEVGSVRESEERQC